jgi:HAAS
MAGVCKRYAGCFGIAVCPLRGLLFSIFGPDRSICGPIDRSQKQEREELTPRFTRMNVNESELAARLPAPSGDEPPSLRQDILDELADHLHCATRRELLATGDEKLARQRVIEKFGDPAEVARRLWNQAMWSKIMSQRIMLGSMAILTATCMALVAMAGWLVQQQRVSAAQQQQVFAETIEKLIRSTESSVKPPDKPIVATPVASSIQAKLTLGMPDGPPATDCTVTLRQLGFSSNHAISEQSDSDGSVDFGYCEPGRYEITVQTLQGFFSRTKRFTLPPSTSHIQQVICPSKLEEAQVNFVLELPDEIWDRGVIALLEFGTGRLAVGEDTWHQPIQPSKRGVLVRPDGFECVLLGQERFVTDLAEGQRRTSLLIESPPTSEQRRSLLLFAGAEYPVQGLRLVVPFRPRASAAMAGAPGTSRYEQVAPKPRPESPGFGPSSESKNAYALDRTLVAKAGEPNEWKILIPDELVTQAREYLQDLSTDSASQK